MDAYGLKGPGRWVFAGFTGGDRLGDDLCQLPRAGDGLFAARMDDGAGDASGIAFFSIAEDDVHQLRLLHFRQPLRRADTATGVHAHVQRSIPVKCKAAFGIIQLR